MCLSPLANHLVCVDGFKCGHHAKCHIHTTHTKTKARDDTDVTPPLSPKCTPLSPSAQSDANTHTNTQSDTLPLTINTAHHCLVTQYSRHTHTHRSSQSCKVIQFTHVCLCIHMPSLPLNPPPYSTSPHPTHPTSITLPLLITPLCGLKEGRRERLQEEKVKQKEGVQDRGRCGKAL